MVEMSVRNEEPVFSSRSSEGDTTRAPLKPPPSLDVALMVSDSSW